MSTIHSTARLLALTSVAFGGMILADTASSQASYLTHLQSTPLSTIVLAATEGKTQAQAGAEAFVGSMAKRALDFLSNAQQTQAQKTESFRRLLEENYDMETIGKFTLGRYWKTATPAQQAEFQKLFRNYVVAMYSQRFSDYKGQQFDVTGSRADGATDTIVSSKVLPADGGQEVIVDWRVRQTGGRYRVVDVVVAGVSMSMTQRSDFASVIQQGGGNIDALISSLKNKT
ncbi:MAG: toluene tolerance, Ttg2 family protein [Micavibrio sp.]|nr:toluene tolerance, Ttg2 family protein [Micavibrio sp.]